MPNSEGWDYNADLGKKATEDVDDVIEREDEAQPDFGFDMEDADDDDAIEPSEGSEVDEPAKKPVGGGTPDAANAQGEVDKLADAVLKHVGGQTLVRIKGIEKPLEQFSKQEIVNWIQKSARADQTFQEAAASRRQVENERQRLEEERARLSRDASPARGSRQRGDA
ncbi:MAG: hypothetical protein MZV63_15670 [Marinilabiliales bacterium]|nr:hypothetical protein [Marinilabiliales bacterium]